VNLGTFIAQSSKQVFADETASVVDKDFQIRLAQIPLNQVFRHLYPFGPRKETQLFNCTFGFLRKTTLVVDVG